ncbi:MAG: hypothetical protein HEQ35_09165 [Gloeotrichia echinulata IR180]|jgi:hypothetical protein|nr:hypothetical protein [Gloeotrichia echinulata DEX184]
MEYFASLILLLFLGGSGDSNNQTTPSLVSQGDPQAVSEPADGVMAMAVGGTVILFTLRKLSGKKSSSSSLAEL